QLVVAPNKVFFQNPLTIRTNRHIRRTTVICGVAYGEDVDTARDVIAAAVAGCDTVLSDAQPVQIFAQEFADSAINFEVTWWTQSKPVDNGGHFAGQGIRIPTLQDALLAFPNARWIMEIKNNTPAAAEATCADIKGAGKEQKVLIASFHDEAMAHFRTVCPNIATSMSSGEVRRFVIAARLGLTRFLRSPAVALQIPAEADGIDLTHPRILAAAKARGIRVQYWTINEPSEMAALFETGADGLMTDYVDRGFVALEARDD
ncbi:MAG: glycerophosphodiester phosphodiesterase family protein, partial [Pseudomonadota bacterium]